jgi:hypothetical protein
MTIEERLHILCNAAPEERPDVLREWLPHAEHRIYPLKGGRRPVENFIVRAEKPALVLGAHHDIDPDTIHGAIDNSASVVMLVHLAERLRARGETPNVEFAFWDYEEPGNSLPLAGSRLYAHGLVDRGASPELIVACDVLGLGHPMVSLDARRATAMLHAGISQQGVTPALRKTPPSDNYAFFKFGFDAALLTSTHPERGVEAWRHLHSPEDHIDLVDIDSLYATAELLEGMALDMQRRLVDVPWRLDPALPETEIPEARQRPARRRPARDDGGQMGFGF